MTLFCIIVTPSGNHRRIGGPSTLSEEEIARISVALLLAGSLLDRDLAATRLSQSLLDLPDTPDQRSRLLTEFLAGSTSGVDWLKRAPAAPDDWFDASGGLSTIAPGLFHLHRAASRLTAPTPLAFAWSPGQVSDVLQAANQICDSPAPEFHDEPSIGESLDALQSFLALAYGNAGHVFGEPAQPGP